MLEFMFILVMLNCAMLFAFVFRYCFFSADLVKKIDYALDMLNKLVDEQKRRFK